MSTDAVRAPISWDRVGRAATFFSARGYSYVETPWRVTRDVVATTIPAWATPFRCELDHGRPDFLVGSAEQGFIALMRSLPDGRYFSASPCFRDNEPADDFHFCDFFKIELCFVGSVAASGDLLCDAWAFAASEGLICDAVDTELGCDLIARGVEVGSFGGRACSLDGAKLRWSYGTGLAEPRFSQVLQLQKESASR